MKLLNGSELAGFIKERQARQVRALKTRPKLAIILTIDHPAINIYIKMKQAYGDDIGIDVDIHRIKQAEAPEVIQKVNNDSSVSGIIVQLPLEDTTKTDEIVNLVAPEKDVDALGKNAKFDPATPMAILWLLNGYNVELAGKKILLVGRGKLVGAPLEKILKSSNYDVVVVDHNTKDLAAFTKDADIIITATGNPGILKASMIKENAVVLDAGVASEEGKTIGDLDPDVYERDDLTITPQKGGVGPLTVCALFENVIRATQNVQS